MAGLPDPSTLPLFQYYDPVTDTLQDITYPDGSQPRRIRTYVLDPTDWLPTNRTQSLGTDGPPHGIKTREEVLAWDTDGTACHICGRAGAKCRGARCRKTFRARTESVYKQKLRIERTTGVAAMGYGVFATDAIRKGVVVREYMGQLFPLDACERRRKKLGRESTYNFVVDPVMDVDARDYGNITRFVNHHCNPNLAVKPVVYGRHRCFAYVAERVILAGDQLFVHYGDEYFDNARPCRCDTVPYPHIPS
ncbi:Histone-lysine N-methyltransferase ehmt1 [Diaporthe australafricana]|uniref:Histone-lysine N-methyltransferase ehmt1 n=1 Tax=Diaporthe australafricana TaxID=127596 RepID=A0ABR3W905_9PEZI